MLGLPYSYEACIRDSEKISWKIDDILPTDSRLSFDLPFLPSSLAGVGALDFLQEREVITLNQISANAYLNLFAFVEEYILVFAVQLAQAEMFGDHTNIRALLRFAEEELKHQKLFRRYREVFEQGFGGRCGVLDNAAAVAGVILGKSALAVLLTTLHIELMTQAHYLESVRGNSNIDPLFASLLHHHWLEESQHARIDALELDKLLGMSTPAQISTAIEEYLGVLGAFDSLLAQQASMDLEAFTEKTGKKLGEEEARRLVASQHAGYRRTFLLSGMNNKTFQEILEKMSRDGATKVSECTATFRA